ncbi:MAG: hypothetical protein ACI4V5_02725 [Prevotella sp.]
MTEQIENETNNIQRPVHRNKSGKYMTLRNILNMIFMIGAIVGIIIFYAYSSQIGTIVILTSMVFKFVECIFRFIK